MDYERFIIDTINKMSGRYTAYRVFSDWVAMTAIAISNAVTLRKEIKDSREEQYKNISSRYKTEELRIFGDMTGALVLAFEDQFRDILGDIYMKTGCGSKSTGQFFTPYHLSYLMAALGFDSHIKEIEDCNEITLNEPSTGGGGSLIAFAQVMKEHGYDYQKQLRVVAQDLDWNGVYMTYIQMSLLGIKATVVQGDTLGEPYTKGYDEMRVLYTPAEMGVLL